MRSAENLVWIDLEMTGLNSATDVILEIATIITDGQLMLLAQSPSLVIHQPDSILTTMNEWCTKQHGLSGLTKAVKESTLTLSHAEEQTLDLVKKLCPPGLARLAGNSVWQDRIFLQKYMP